MPKEAERAIEVEKLTRGYGHLPRRISIQTNDLTASGINRKAPNPVSMITTDRP
jgi:hypothetical protein